MIHIFYQKEKNMNFNNTEADTLYNFFVASESNDETEYNKHLDNIKNKLLSWDVDLMDFNHTLSVQFMTLEIFIKTR